MWLPSIVPARSSANTGRCSIPSCCGEIRRLFAPALRKTRFVRGEARSSRVTGPSSSCAPWTNTPMDTPHPRPYCSSRRSTEMAPSPSRNAERWASGMPSFSRLLPRGSHVRVPTLRRSGCPNRRKTHYRPGRSHPRPGRICARWTTDRNFMESSHVLQSHSTSRAWSHYFAYPRKRVRMGNSREINANFSVPIGYSDRLRLRRIGCRLH